MAKEALSVDPFDLLRVRRTSRVHQAELAAALGIGRSTVSEIENGHVLVSEEFREKWAAACAEIAREQGNGPRSI